MSSFALLLYPPPPPTTFLPSVPSVVQLWLCLPCGGKYTARNYCPKCMVTWVDGRDDAANALGCSACDFWVHAECEGVTKVYCIFFCDAFDILRRGRGVFGVVLSVRGVVGR